MKKYFFCGLIVIFLTYILVTPADAQEDAEYLCYWRRLDGTVVNLSKLCRQQVTNSTNLSADAAFIADYQALANQYPDNIRQGLQSYIDQNSDSAIASALATCRVLKFGGKAAELSRRQSLTASDSSPITIARNQIIPALAINHYCPGLRER